MAEKMIETVLELKVIEPTTDLDNICIGSSRFTDDLWNLAPFIKSKSIQPSQKIIKFGYIKNENIKNTVKLYAYYKLGKVQARTVYNKIAGCLPRFIEYCEMNDIESFTSVTKDDFLNFNLWMKFEKKLSAAAGFLNCQVVKEIILTGQIKGWNVPQTNILAGIEPGKLWSMKERNEQRKLNRTKPIPEDVFNKIFHHAMYDEKNILTKTGIIFQSQTGLRINEILSTQEGCIKTTSDKDNYIETELGKTEKGEAIIHKVFINDLVKNAIEELEKATENLRKKAD